MKVPEVKFFPGEVIEYRDGDGTIVDKIQSVYVNLHADEQEVMIYTISDNELTQKDVVARYVKAKPRK